MSKQIKINSKIIKYLATIGYRPNPVIDELTKKTKALGKISQMQIAPEQGQFLEMIVKLCKILNYF